MARYKRPDPKRRSRQSKKNKLPLFLALGGVVLLIVAAFSLFRKPSTPYVAEVNGNPSLQVDKEKVDLGDVKLGNTVQVSFELKNVGDRPLVFSKTPFVEVKEGC